MCTEFVIVTGYFGAPIEETARRIAEERGFAYLSLDGEIEKRDGRSISRLVMMNGEHGYRNQEYEILNEINEDPAKFAGGTGGIVVSCGDGVLYDDMSREIAQANKLVIAGSDMSADELWSRAKASAGTYHAFMAFGTDDEKRRSFDKFIDRQRLLFGKTEAAE